MLSTGSIYNRKGKCLVQNNCSIITVTAKDSTGTMQIRNINVLYSDYLHGFIRHSSFVDRELEIAQVKRLQRRLHVWKPSPGILRPTINSNFSHGSTKDGIICGRAGLCWVPLQTFSRSNTTTPILSELRDRGGGVVILPQNGFQMISGNDTFHDEVGGDDERMEEDGQSPSRIAR